MKLGIPYRFRVSNGTGHEVERVVYVPAGVDPRSYSLVAIACARRVFSPEEQLRVQSIEAEPQLGEGDSKGARPAVGPGHCFSRDSDGVLPPNDG